MKKENIKIWAGRATPEILPVVSRLFAEAGVQKSQDLLEWQYLQSPGNAYVALAHDDRGLIDGAGALYAALPINFQVKNKTLLGVQSFDTFTSEPCRGRGLFPRLAQVVYDLAADNGVSLIYGFPNDSSCPGFKGKLGWQMLDPLPMRVRPIGTRFLRIKLRSRIPQIIQSEPLKLSKSVQRIKNLPEDFDNLFNKWVTSDYVGVRRDRSYLVWRMRRPGATYIFYEWRSSTGSLEAFGISELRLKHGCSLGYIMELLYSPGNRHAGRSVLQAMLCDFRHSGADLVLAWCFKSKNKRNIFLESGFLPFPTRFRPISLHFGYRILKQDSLPLLLKRDDWYLSYLDSDTV